jgi:nucleotide-binding universal stress UspA family protein
MFKKILVATDGSSHARKTIGIAGDMALRYGAQLFLVHVIPSIEISEELQEYIETEYPEESPAAIYPELVGDKILGQAVGELKKKGLNKVQTEVLIGDPAKKIVEFAEQMDVDIIVLGSHGLGGFAEFVLGSVANKVCHLAKKTCVTVK